MKPSKSKTAMNEKQSLLEQINKLQNELKESLINDLLEVKNNKRYKKINEHCFIVKYKHIKDDSWSPEYHDFQYILNKLIESIKTDADGIKIIEKLKDLVHRNYIYLKSEALHVHPTLIEKLINIANKY